MHVYWHANCKTEVYFWRVLSVAGEMSVTTFAGWLKSCCCYSLKLCSNRDKLCFLSPLSQHYLPICKESCKCLLKSRYIFNNIVFFIAVVGSQWNCDDFKVSHSRSGMGTVFSDMTIKGKIKKLFSLTDRFQNVAIWQNI